MNDEMDGMTITPFRSRLRKAASDAGRWKYASCDEGDLYSRRGQTVWVYFNRADVFVRAQRAAVVTDPMSGRLIATEVSTDVNEVLAWINLEV